MTATEPKPVAPPRPRTTVGVVDVLLVLAVAALVTFPLVSKLAADAQPIAPRKGVTLAPLPAHPRGGELRALPAGLDPGVADLKASAEAALGPRRAAELLRLARDGPRFGTADRYPYANARLVRLVRGATADLGARLLLSTGQQTADSGRATAGVAAYAVLDQARRAGDCAPQLDLLALVAADGTAPAAAVAREASRARVTCPGDPTPLWLLGQSQSQRGDLAQALATFRALEREFPGSAVGWSGEADAYVRAAGDGPPTAKFTALDYDTQALARYRRAARLDPNPELQFGIARALAGLGQPADAARIQQAALKALPSATDQLAGLALSLEAAHRWAPAAQAAERLRDVRPRPVTGIFPTPRNGEDDDTGGPISLGTGTLTPVRIFFQLPATGTEAGGVTIADTSFLPPFRESDALAGERWCAGVFRMRDLVIAGEPGAALEGAARSRDPAPGHDANCGEPDEFHALEAVARLEAGDRAGARALAARDSVSLRGVQDARQNLWRWAGDLPRAAQVADEWRRAAPGDPLPVVRIAEIDYLRGRYDAAARDFATAARHARARSSAAEEAMATLERGLALKAAGRRPEALRAYAAAEDMASRTMAADQDEPTLPGVAYYARAELADAAREDGNLRAAAEWYAGARELFDGRPPFPEHEPSPARVDNNGAIVSSALGRTRSAAGMARRAIETDPRSPVFLATAAAVAAHAERSADAIRLTRATLIADPTTWPAANDLGVLLARQGHDDAAVAALRRAVGANERYALGWFNLGVVLSGMGPLRLPAAQGSLARAITLDPALRDRARRPTLDTRTYRSGLDLARALPPDWNFAESQKRAPAKTAGLAAILLAAYALARALGTTKSGRGLAETWLPRAANATAKLKLPSFLRHPAVAIVVTFAVLLYPLARDPGGGRTAALAGSLALVLLVLVVLRARLIAARRAESQAKQETWPLGIVFGLGSAAAGLTWAPLPVVREGANARVHWAGALALAVIAVPLVIFTAWLDVPLTRAVATAALVMAASLLTPIKPVDGGAIAAAGGKAAGLTGLGLAVLLAVGLI